jgi:Domain of unknown function (DUF6647)
MTKHLLMIAGLAACLVSPTSVPAQQLDSVLEIASHLAAAPPKFAEALNHPRATPEALGQPVQRSMRDGLLDLIASWLSTNFDLPNTSEMPRIEVTSAARIAALRFGRLFPTQPAPKQVGNGSTEHTNGTVLAIYSDKTNTIFLPLGWSGASPAEHSMLVHEMVHHLQRQAQVWHGCPEEREKLAYEAQDKWLALFGTSLEKEFGLDAFTVLAKSLCKY